MTAPAYRGVIVDAAHDRENQHPDGYVANCRRSAIGLDLQSGRRVGAAVVATLGLDVASPSRASALSVICQRSASMSRRPNARRS